MSILFMRMVKVNKSKLWLRDDEIEGFIEKVVTPSGNGAKVDVPKRYIGTLAYVVLRKK
jgi:putative transposon-encoded protein